jgi:hypothetical protein
MDKELDAKKLKELAKRTDNEDLKKSIKDKLTLKEVKK